MQGLSLVGVLIQSGNSAVSEEEEYRWLTEVNLMIILRALV